MNITSAGKASATKTSITLAGIGSQISPSRFSQLADAVIGLVACLTDTDERDLVANARGKAKVATARHVAMYLLHTFFGFSLIKVAGIFSRDRTTVAHACRRIEQMRDCPSQDALLLRLESLLDLFTLLSISVEADRT